MVPSNSRGASSPTEDPREFNAQDLEDIDTPGLDLLSLSRAVKARKSEYTCRQTIQVKVGTWNVAAISGTEKDIGKWFVQGQGVCEKFSGLKGSDFQRNVTTGGSSGSNEEKEEAQKEGRSAKPFQCSPEEVDLYVLGLQEVVDISSPTEALRPFVDSGPSTRWKDAVQKALPQGYQLVSEVQLLGLLLLIYASPAIAESVSSVSTSSVGTGLMGYMGNKGAVATRVVLGETTRLVFVNSHLAAGSDKGSLERRNWDASQIVSRTKFESADPERTQNNQVDVIGDEDFTFWFGDLNYRLDDIPGDDVRQCLARHTVNAYDTARQEKQKLSSRQGSKVDSDPEPESNPPSPTEGEEYAEPVGDEEIDPHNDPASLQTTISSLIVHDQLRTQQKKGTAFHKGWNEGQISFLPTYKYDVGSVAMFDSSEKQRGPSWCDRILYRTRRDMLKHEQQEREIKEARKRDKEMEARGLDKAVADYNVLFEYDPETDGADGGDGSDGAADVDDYISDEDAAKFASNSPRDSSQDLTEDLAQDSISLHHYISHQGILSSDHKPLDAIFTLNIDAVNPSLKAKVHQEVVRELDKVENESRPGLTVVVDTPAGEKRSEGDPNAVDFGTVPYDVPVHRTLTIANTSSTPATFSFAERPGFEGDHKNETESWLDIQINHVGESHSDGEAVSSHTLHPGEVAHVNVTIHVRLIKHVRLLNLKKIKLEEILVLHVDSGRDHFISVSGQWLPTCFGCSVDELTRMPEAGARSLAADGTASLSKGDNEVRLSAPRELFRLTEAISELAERAVAEWSMTKGESGEEPPWAKDPSGAAWPFELGTWTLKEQHERAPLLASVREALDTNKSLYSTFAPEIPPLHRLEILSETLLSFLNSLSDGIVTASVWQEMEQHMLAREKTKAPPRTWEESQAWVLESLAYSPAHSVSFTFVTFMLARIANEVAPVPSTAQPTSPSSRKERPSDADSKSKEENTSESQLQPPTPASAAAFIAAGSFRRKNRSPTVTDSDPSAGTASQPAARRQSVESSFASIFARVLISASVSVPTKEKDRRASDERKKSIIEPFLKMIGVDERGPSGGR
ncbi:hypothetical protein N7476_002033 [Penicillium atrosanguineum]|uniref:Inositol polyphosphate-related phosphatase domain-containing protein n=1 Tax=Penicillium atrosanguineum TaxID=1132637 RepID=A0A9W9U8A4_9EURO|nr:hypothetical protein N7526_006127 [Penicillium atrosanguineum]KAJ5323433.1 hypothetical protein N7476_002033 [Penicillium atrosanguineum]